MQDILCNCEPPKRVLAVKYDSECAAVGRCLIFAEKEALVLSRDGRPAPRGTLPAGRGGSPPRLALCGGGGSLPRPVKMIKTAGKLRGKIKAYI